ncbi:hypothetical protein MP638_006486 [Amoeboaphelidium occidentale]|nr:hypothetical protein MP638_006486 [Amoeboaphelidium occidentale]
MIITKLILIFIIHFTYSLNVPLEKHSAQDPRDYIRVDLLSPTMPITAELNDPLIFMFRADLEGKVYDTVKIYLAKGEKPYLNSTAAESNSITKLKQLSNLKVHQGVSNYMVIWTPKLEDIPQEGGDDFFLIVVKPSWWGWVERPLFESEYFTVAGLESFTDGRILFQ